MNKMATALIQAGFRVVNLDYPSREKSIEAIAAEDLARAVQRCERAGAQRIHFVTHSLGGIVVRQALSQKKPANLGRVVMLSPPNRGSFVAEKLKNWRLYRWLYGPAGQELGTGEDSLPNRLGPVDYEVGVITGSRHVFFDAWFAALIPAENDGKVSVAEAGVAGMADFLVVPETHPFIMNADRVIQQTIFFLRHGKFSRP
jgi:pimeloyl-ACP methyl ester carboxylesterase